MDPKVLIPVVGLSGTVAGLAGISNSGSRPHLPADLSPTHNWKPQSINPIEISFKCSSGEVEVNYATDHKILKVKGNVHTDKLQSLMSLNQIDIDVELEFEAPRGWGADQSAISRMEGVDMTVEEWESQKGIQILLHNRGVGGGVHDDKRFYCKIESSDWKWLKKERDNETIFFSNMEERRYNKLVSKGGTQRKVRVSRGNCRPEKNTSICDLQLSDVNGSSWSTTVSEKAKYDVSP